MPLTLSKCLYLAPVLLLAACATKPPLEIAGADLDSPPQEVVQNFDAARDTRVVWGGVIISSRNLENSTELEVLAFPLESGSLWPHAEQPAEGRFLLRQPGYLETLDYAPGRYITAVGRVSELRDVEVGESKLQYPVVEAGQVHLWRERPTANEPRFRFGFGLILHN